MVVGVSFIVVFWGVCNLDCGFGDGVDSCVFDLDCWVFFLGSDEVGFRGVCGFFGGWVLCIFGNVGDWILCVMEVLGVVVLCGVGGGWEGNE